MSDTSNKKECCGECRYWKSSNGDFGSCHRFPPMKNMGVLVDDWRGTHKWVWCGEFRAKEEPKTEGYYPWRKSSDEKSEPKPTTLGEDQANNWILRKRKGETLSDVGANAQTYKEEFKRRENERIAEKIVKYLNTSNSCLETYKEQRGWMRHDDGSAKLLILAALEAK